VVFLREAVQVEVVKGSGEQQQRKRTKRDGEQPGGKSEATVSGGSGEARSDGAEGGMRTEEVLVIYDKMPKARRHMLVLPLREIDSPQTLKRFHLPVLRALHATALKTVAMYACSAVGLLPDSIERLLIVITLWAGCRPRTRR
jgi:hypothetical protein